MERIREEVLTPVALRVDDRLPIMCRFIDPRTALYDSADGVLSSPVSSFSKR